MYLCGVGCVGGEFLGEGFVSGGLVCGVWSDVGGRYGIGMINHTLYIYIILFWGGVGFGGFQLKWKGGVVFFGVWWCLCCFWAGKCCGGSGGVWCGFERGVGGGVECFCVFGGWCVGGAVFLWVVGVCFFVFLFLGGGVWVCGLFA